MVRPATDEVMRLAYARARASGKKRGAYERYWLAVTDEERAEAERDWDAATAELDALPPLVPASALTQMPD